MKTQIRALKTALPTSYRIADHVDHPMILEGPDLLVGGEGKLSAFYNSEGKRSHQNLYARVVASKLALPSHCLHIFVMGSESYIDFNAGNFETGQVFDQIIDINDITRRSVLSQRPRVGLENELRKIKEYHGMLYSRTFQFSIARRKYQRNDGSSSRVAYHLRKECTRRMWVSKYRGVDFSAREKAATLYYVKKLCEHRFSEYVFDNAVPYPKTFGPGIAVSEKIPEIKNDPEKPLRAAAFAGWIMTDASSIEELDAIIDRAHSFGFGTL